MHLCNYIMNIVNIKDMHNYHIMKSPNLPLVDSTTVKYSVRPNRNGRSPEVTFFAMESVTQDTMTLPFLGPGRPGSGTTALNMPCWTLKSGEQQNVTLVENCTEAEGWVTPQKLNKFL